MKIRRYHGYVKRINSGVELFSAYTIHIRGQWFEDSFSGDAVQGLWLWTLPAMNPDTGSSSAYASFRNSISFTPDLH